EPVADTLPGYEALGFTAIAVRAGTPRDICDQIETAVMAIAKEPAFRERMAGMLAAVVGSGAQDAAAFLAAERAQWGKLITDLQSNVGEASWQLPDGRVSWGGGRTRSSTNGLPQPAQSARCRLVEDPGPRGRRRCPASARARRAGRNTGRHRRHAGVP